MSDQQSNPNSDTPTPKQAPSEADLLDMIQIRRRELGLNPDGSDPKCPIDPIDAFVDAIDTFDSVQKSDYEIEEDEREQREHAERMEQERRKSLWRDLCFKRGMRYADCRLNTFDVATPSQQEIIDTLQEYVSEMVLNVRQGSGVVLYGPPGTGKDHLVTSLMHKAIMQYGMTVSWENGMNLFGEIRDRMESEQAESAFIHRMVYPAILVISDPVPPSGPLTNFQNQMLYRIVDGRYSARKPTWITINVAHGEEAAQRLGEQTYQRLRHNAVCLFCNWPSYRKAK